MRHRSKIWTKLAARGKFRMETVAVINGVTYTKISAPKIERSLMSEPLSVGNCISATLQISILTDDIIETSKPIIIKSRLTDGELYSEWLEFGTFYIDVPEQNYEGLQTFTCYDSMLKTSQVYVDETDDESEWPKSMKTCVEEIAYRIGVGIDPRTRINVGSDYVVSFPSERTMQQVLGFIGAIHGGNWIITEENLLRLVPIISSPDDTFNIIDQDYETVMTDDGYRLAYRLTDKERVEVQPDIPGLSPNSYFPISRKITDETYNPIVTSDGYYLVWGLDGSADAVGGLIHVPIVIGNITTGKNLTVSKVTMSDENGNTYSFGNNTGFEIKIESNPYVNHNNCKALYTAFKGLIYTPYTATKTCYDPATELGDWVKIGDKVCSVIYTMSQCLDIDYRSDISAPNNNEVSRTYPFLSEFDKMKSQRFLKASSNYSGVTLTVKNGLVIKKIGTVQKPVQRNSYSVIKAEAYLNEDHISFRGINAEGIMEECLFYDDSIGKYRIKNNVQIDEIAALQTFVEGIQANVERNSENLETFNETVSKNVEEISKINHTIESTKNQVDSFVGILEETNSEIQALQTAVQNIEKLLSEISERLEVLENKKEIE